MKCHVCGKNLGPYDLKKAAQHFKDNHPKEYVGFFIWLKSR